VNSLESSEYWWNHEPFAAPAGSASDCGTKKEGFEVIRTRGSHHFLQHHEGRATVVPVHAGETMGPGLLAKILRDCDLTRRQFQALL
jgi:predicted RNA binding protein YcfA (HicA-like mRNA interferase family)